MCVVDACFIFILFFSTSLHFLFCWPLFSLCSEFTLHKSILEQQRGNCAWENTHTECVYVASISFCFFFFIHYYFFFCICLFAFLSGSEHTLPARPCTNKSRQINVFKLRNLSVPKMLFFCRLFDFLFFFFLNNCRWSFFLRHLNISHSFRFVPHFFETISLKFRNKCVIVVQNFNYQLCVIVIATSVLRIHNAQIYKWIFSFCFISLLHIWSLYLNFIHNWFVIILSK